MYNPLSGKILCGSRLGHLKEPIKLVFSRQSAAFLPFFFAVSSLPPFSQSWWMQQSLEAVRNKSLLLSAGAGRRLSVPSALLDESISNSTLILAAHCLFFFLFFWGLRDEMELERRATRQIVKVGLRHREPGPSLETPPDDFSTHQRRERDGVGGTGTLRSPRRQALL